MLLQAAEFGRIAGSRVRSSVSRESGFTAWAPAWLALLVFVVVVCPPSARAAEPESHDAAYINLLDYNIDGGFRLMTGESRREPIREIGRLARSYDLILVQEDFEYDDILREQLPQAETHRGAGAWSAPRLLLPKLIALPFNILIPRFSAPYGAGISTLVRSPLVSRGAEHGHYSACYGWFRYDNDCLAAKGYVQVTVELPNGASVDVYNSHLDAGRDEGDLAARTQELGQLAQAIERISPGKALIVGGDFNSQPRYEYDLENIRRFSERLGLEDSGAKPQSGAWHKQEDWVLYRSSADVRLTVESAGEAEEFVRDGRPLSDHEALRARFRVEHIR